jgi:hypothetical protein
MSAVRTKLPFAASAPKDGLPMSALRTELPLIVSNWMTAFERRGHQSDQFVSENRNCFMRISRHNSSARHHLVAPTTKPTGKNGCFLGKVTDIENGVAE